jgi:hypothetical protein
VCSLNITSLQSRTRPVPIFQPAPRKDLRVQKCRLCGRSVASVDEPFLFRFVPAVAEGKGRFVVTPLAYSKRKSASSARANTPTQLPRRLTQQSQKLLLLRSGRARSFRDSAINPDSSVLLQSGAIPYRIGAYKVLDGPNPTGHAVWWDPRLWRLGHHDVLLHAGRRRLRRISTTQASTCVCAATQQPSSSNARPAQSTSRPKTAWRSLQLRAMAAW